MITISLEKCNDMISIKLNDNSLHKIKVRNVIISMKHPDEDLMKLKDEIDKIESPLSFSLTTRDFKDTISDATSYGDRITIEKHGQGPLILKFIRAHTNVCSEEYSNEDKIELKSSIGNNESFICTLHTLLLKCISVSIMNNRINVKCLNENKALLTSTIGDLINFTIVAENTSAIH